MFEVFLKADDIRETVVLQQQFGKASPSTYTSFFADPIPLGTSDYFIDDSEDGSHYMLFSFVSQIFGGTPGEGQIAAVRLHR